jgi:hypothetical protein
MSTRNLTRALFSALLLSALATSVSAFPVKVVHVDTPDCDPLFIPQDVHEIGDIAVFPPNESLFATVLGLSPVIPCPPNDNPSLPEFLVDIRNTSGRVWTEVWYVANAETTITNIDGEANDIAFPPLREAFRIDNGVSDPGGTHLPLVSESMTPDGIWEIGESWQFVLQDYANSLGLPPNAINSLGVGDASAVGAGGVVTSSGSIIATTIPEPATLLLSALAAAGVLVGRRRVPNT